MDAAKKFLIGETEELEFDSVRQAKELFYQIRHIYQKVKSLNSGKPQSQNLPEEMQKPQIEEEEKKPKENAKQKLAKFLENASKKVAESIT